MLSALRSVCEPTLLVTVAALVIGCAGLPGLFLRKSGTGQMISAILTVLASLAGLTAAVTVLTGTVAHHFILNWGLPFGSCPLILDSLSAFFMIPVFLIAAVGTVYSAGYYSALQNSRGRSTATFFYGLLPAAMAVLLLARNSVMFLMAWEVMALSAYFLVIVDHELEAVRRAGKIYLLATHIGTAALLIFFSVLAGLCGSYEMPAVGTLSTVTAGVNLMVVAAFIGFGAKAGIMPLHIWLPSAHANAPSHVSAIMSGVMLKMGLYGILRTLTFFHDIPMLWGAVLTGAGMCSALLGILFAIAQKDVKRLLACSSIENIGIITAGIGIAMLGVSSGSPVLFYTGMTGALLHLLNHSIFKPLLFFVSGAVIHACGTRDMNLMGGLGRVMPAVALFSMLGTVAICGIPPLNGFVGEFFIYLGFFARPVADGSVFLVMLAPLLALIGGLAVIAFTKFYSSVFLGMPRSPAVHHGHAVNRAMLLPMLICASLCLLIGMFPFYAVRLTAPVLTGIAPGIVVTAQAAQYSQLLNKLSTFSIILFVAMAVIALCWRWLHNSSTTSTCSTWACGYQRSTSRMQYGGSAFSELTVSVFDGIMRQSVERPVLHGIFPGYSSCGDMPTETMLDRMVRPFVERTGALFTYLRRLQLGLIHIYMIYIFATLLILMLWAH